MREGGGRRWEEGGRGEKAGGREYWAGRGGRGRAARESVPTPGVQVSYTHHARTATFI